MKADNIKITPRWEKSKEQVWAETFAGLEDAPVAETATVELRGNRVVKSFPLNRRRVFSYAAAAVVAVMLILPTAAFLYTKDVVAQRGEHIVVVLPDGSQVTLNAESSIIYKPYWWRVSRNVKMSGEAYFEVAKGERFTVESHSGTVSVLGTSFNIFDRAEGYNVSCLTGKVSVESIGQSVILTPGMSAKLESGNLASSNFEQADEAGWIAGKFSFNSAPLKNVIAEVERQYNITIKTPANINYLYTGNFSKDKSPEQVLEIIGKPFGIELSIEK